MTSSKPSGFAPYTKRHLDALSVEVKMVTPKMARDLRDSCHFERQRRLSEPHILFLSREMSHKYFLEGTPVWFCVMPDNSMVIVNGNHTLEAVNKAGIAVPLTFVYQKVSSLEQAADVYACFDIQRTRTFAQAAQAKGLDEKIPMMRETLSSLQHINRGFRGSHTWKSSRQEIFDLIDPYTSAVLLLNEALSQAPRDYAKLVKRSGIFSIALVTAKYQPSVAEEFWHQVAMDDGLKADDPRKSLLRYLLSTRGSGGGWKRIEADFMAASAAWNAFFEDRPLSQIRIHPLDRLRIAGTPWGGKKKDAIITGTMLDKNGESVPVTQFVG